MNSRLDFENQIRQTLRRRADDVTSGRDPAGTPEDAEAVGSRSSTGSRASILATVSALLIAGGAIFLYLSDPAGQRVAAPGTTEESAANPAIAEDLVPYLFPVDGIDYRRGAEAIELPILDSYHDRMGACLTDSGHPTIGSLMAAAPQTKVADVWRFPELDELDLSGFLPPMSDPVLNLMGNVSPGSPVTSEDDLMVQELRSHPEYGLEGTVEEADALNSAISACIPRVELSSDAELAMSIRLDWFFEVDTIDAAPELQEPILAAGECLVDAGVLTGEIGGVDEIRKGIASAVTGLQRQREPDPRQLSQIGRFYGRCITPLDEARRPLREAARTEKLDENETLLDRLSHTLP